jgi:surface antigen
MDTDTPHGSVRDVTASSRVFSPLRIGRRARRHCRADGGRKPESRSDIQEVHMIRARRDTILGLSLLVLLAGCQGQQLGISTAAGGIGGATAGGLLGAALGGGNTGIAGGVLLGGLLGAGVGQMLDQRSQQMQSQTVARALEGTPAGTASTWRNPDNGNSGRITPTRTFQNQAGAYCREFQQELVVGGQTQQATSTACRQPDGSWQTQS